MAESLRHWKIKDPLYFFGQILVVLGLLAVARDLGGAMLFYFTALIIIFAATSRWDLGLIGIAGAAISGFIGYQLFGHVRVRVKAWLNPWEDVPGKGYQIVQSLFAMAEGGFFGAVWALVGLITSRQLRQISSSRHFLRNLGFWVLQHLLLFIFCWYIVGLRYLCQ